MAAILTSTGITFGDGTILESKYGIVPQSSVAVFYQADAPTGWSKVTTQNNKALRIVSGTGGGSGGTTAFTSAFPNSLKPITATVPITGTVEPHTLTTAQIPAHAHTNGGSIGLSQFGGDVSIGPGWTRNSPGTGNQPAPNGGAHTHPFTGGSGSFSVNLDFRVQYIDVIICSFS